MKKLYLALLLTLLLVSQRASIAFADSFGCGAGGGVDCTLTSQAPLSGDGSGGSPLGCDVASGSQPGCLSAANWTTFNGKQSVLTDSAGLAAALSDETGSGAACFANTPTLVTPILGVATATSINKVTITAPATSATLTIADGKTVTATQSVTLGNGCLNTKFVRKTADESVTSSTTVQNDDALLFAIAANETWTFEMTFFATGSTAGDMSATITAPAAATGTFAATTLSSTASTNQGSVALPATTTFGAVFTNLGMAGAAVMTVNTIKGIVLNSSTAGNVTLQWAQDASSATATTIYTNSYLLACRVA